MIVVDTSALNALGKKARQQKSLARTDDFLALHLTTRASLKRKTRQPWY